MQENLLMSYIANKIGSCSAKTGMFLLRKQATRFKSSLLIEFHKKINVYKRAVVMKRHMIFIKRLFKNTLQELSK